MSSPCGPLQSGRSRPGRAARHLRARPDPLKRSGGPLSQEYAEWARRYSCSLQFGDYVRGARGPRRGGRGDKTAPAILNPPNGAVYYREPNRDSTIHIRPAGTGPAGLESSCGLLWEGRLPADIPWTLEPGITTFTLIRNGRRDSRRIKVR